MNRKEIVVKLTVKKAVAALRVIVIPAFLLCCRGTLMNVQAACETPAQQENIIEEAQPQIEAEEVTQIPEESVEEATQAETESAEGEAQTEAESVEEEPQEQAEIVEEPLSVTMVGDSVMLGASPAILGMMPDCVIDAKVSRQVIQAHDVLDSLEKQGSLRQTVVIGLGTNGPFSVATGQEIINRLGSGRTIYWVTAYGRDLRWQEESNATIRKLAEDNENVHIIDWAQAASGHAEWFVADGIHLSAQGRAAYAGIVLGGLS
ncbi:MAG: hypothetical protein K2N43_09495 [Lachnospiraceae bacterium]|nr:hypothetical protein [Lachnospiraceae bacterium]